MSEKLNGLNQNEDSGTNKDNIIDEVMNIFTPKNYSTNENDGLSFSENNNTQVTEENKTEEVKNSFEYSPFENETQKEQLNNIKQPEYSYTNNNTVDSYKENYNPNYQNNRPTQENTNNTYNGYNNQNMNNQDFENKHFQSNKDIYQNQSVQNNGYGQQNYNPNNNFNNQQNYNNGYNNNYGNMNNAPYQGQNNQQPYNNNYNNQSNQYTQTRSTQYQSYINSNDPNKADWSYQNDIKKKTDKVIAKKIKKEKPITSNKGIKVFAFIMSMLFVFSAISFAGYVIWTETNDNDTANNDIFADGSNNGLSLNQDNTPVKNDSQNVTGTLRPDEIYKKVAPSVVGIAVYTKGAAYQLAGQGSGIIMKSDGYIITNAHVVQDTSKKLDIAKIEVILSTGETYDASLVGADIETDLAVIKIEAQGLPEATFGDSSKLSVGDSVLVIGNPNGVEYAGSLTQGVVSALNRNVYMNQLGATLQYIQTDAAINPGNSGGAFINEYGQIVGISSAKLVITGFEGMGFAIPINNAKPIIDSIIENGYVKGRVKIGIFYEPVPKVLAELNGIPEGLRVVQFDGEPDAKKQGVKIGDIITKMDGNAVNDADTIGKALEGKKPGDNLKLSVFRVNPETGRGNEIDIDIKLEEKKPANIAS